MVVCFLSRILCCSGGSFYSVRFYYKSIVFCVVFSVGLGDFWLRVGLVVILFLGFGFVCRVVVVLYS